MVTKPLVFVSNTDFVPMLAFLPERPSNVALAQPDLHSQPPNSLPKDPKPPRHSDEGQADENEENEEEQDGEERNEPEEDLNQLFFI